MQEYSKYENGRKIVKETRKGGEREKNLDEASPDWLKKTLEERRREGGKKKQTNVRIHRTIFGWIKLLVKRMIRFNQNMTMKHIKSINKGQRKARKTQKKAPLLSRK